MSNKLKYVKILTLLFMGIFAISGYDFTFTDILKNLSFPHRL